MKKWLVILLLAGAVVFVGVAALLAQRAAEAEREVIVLRANADALLDTIQRYVDDSTQTATRMATQAEINADSIADLMGSLGLAIRERDETLVALNTMHVEFAALREEFTSTDVAMEPDPDAPAGDSTETATFEIAGPPIQGSLWVTRRMDLPWNLRTDLSVTPFQQVYSVGCDDLRRAVVNVTTPEWVNTTLQRGTVDPDVCNPIQPVPVFAFSTGKAIWAGGGVVIGALIAKLLINTTTTVVQTGEPYDPHWQY